MAKNNRLYNYLVNTLGISREMVFKYIDERLEELVSKHLLAKIDSNWTHQLIINRVAEFVKNGKIGPWYKTESFESIVEEIIKRVVEDMISKKYSISVIVKNNDDQ